MAQFKIILSNTEIIYPNELTIEKKKELNDRCQNEGLKLFCGCNGKNEYGIRKNTWAIYPLSKENEHEDWCPKSKVYKRKIVYNKGFEVDEKSGNVQVYLAESIKNEKNGNDREQVIIRDFSHGNRDRKYPEYHQNRITISAMIKKMNMLTFRHVAFSKGENNNLYPNADKMRDKIYWAEKRTKIDNYKKSIADLDRIKDKCRFEYEMLKEIPEFSEKDSIVKLLTNRRNKNNERVMVPVYRDALERALVEYERTYSTQNMQNRNIVMSGFRDIYAMHDLRFLLVNDFGLFSESLYEVEMYNAICKIFNENRLKEKGAYFYKPFEYGYGAYEDKYLEDGIIEFEKSNKKIIIEVYGRDDDEYLEKKKIKSKILESGNSIYRYISWNAYKKEPLPEKEIESIINEILLEEEP